MAKRGNTRLNCVEKCQLHLNGSLYVVSMMNISHNGMLIHSDTKLSNVQLGDKCGVYLCSDHNLCPCEFACEVIRIESSDIALKFTNIES